MITLIISATRISDGAPVILKRLFSDDDIREVEIARLLSAPPNGSHPSNHCMPVIEVLDVPEENTMFLVSPFFTAWDSPPFATVGEAVEFFRQIFQVCTTPGQTLWSIIQNTTEPSIHAQP